MLFSPCNPCCDFCQIVVTVRDLCNQLVNGAHVTITQHGSTDVLDQGNTNNGVVILKTGRIGFFDIKVTATDLQDTQKTIFACDTCACLIPRKLDVFASVNFARQGDYFNNVASSPETSPYQVSYGLRPSGIPRLLNMIAFDSTTNRDSTASPTVITLPDTGWYSQAIPGTRLGVNTNFYFYLWFINCKANLLMIDISESYKAGAVSSIAVYTIGQCATPCICPYIPNVLNLTSPNTALQDNATLTYQTIPGDISRWLGSVPQTGWFSDQVVPQQVITKPPYVASYTINGVDAPDPSLAFGNFGGGNNVVATIPAYRYYFFCNTSVSQKYALLGLPLNGQTINPFNYPRGFIEFGFTSTHDTYTGNGLPIFPDFNCNPFRVTGFHSIFNGNGGLMPLVISGTIDNNSIRIPDFILSTVRPGGTFYIWGSHATDDIELNKSGNGGEYS